MRLKRLFSAIGVSLWSVVVAGNQAAPAMVLPEALRLHLRDERFAIVTSIRGLPLGVRNELQTLWSSKTLDIADPREEFQLTDVNVNPALPTRRLVAAGCARDSHCLVYYERGGKSRTWLVALFLWTPVATRFEGGGIAPGGLQTIDDVRNALLTGAIRSANRNW
jgi:hypothetical protein